MTSEKKPSIYSDRGAIGSADELDQYGVWVKSEPQDLSAAGDDTQEFTGLVMPDFGLDGNSDPLPDMELAIPGEKDSGDDDDFEPLAIPGFDSPEESLSQADDSAGDTPESGGLPVTDISTRLLMKIADELSSIRTELATLKQEFAGIRSRAAGDDKDEAQHGGFFAEEDDEKIALTGDEMDDILNTADLIVEESPSAETAVEEAGEISMGIPAAVEEPADEPEEEIEIDLEDLGINLDDLVEEVSAETEQPPAEELDISLDTDLNIDLSTEENTADKTTQEGDGTGLLDSLDEMHDFHIEDIEPLTTPPEDTSYLEEDPLAMDDLSLNESALDISLDETALDLGLAGEVPFDAAALDLSEAVIDEPDLSIEIMENPVLEPVLEGISIDEDIPIELEDEYQSENITADIVDNESEKMEESLAQVIPEGFEIAAEEASVPFDDDLEGLAEVDLSDPVALPEIPEPEIVVAAPVIEEEPPAPEEAPNIPPVLKKELKNVLSYMDHLLESLPEEKIEEFAKSEYFDTYKKLFKELGLV
jgi:hypothetical protein